jgi:hypothetical protein
MSSGGVNTAQQNSPSGKANFTFQIRDGSDWTALKRRSIQTYTENRLLIFPQNFTTQDPWFSRGNVFRSETIQGCNSCTANTNTL